ncbi:MAG: flagellar basal-body rod protein FlgF [Candidatus Baltobacteraceae bacterium]
MVRGLYSAAAGALVAQAAADNIANNLANVNTSGFKTTLLQVQSAPTLDLYRIQTDPGQTAGRRTPGTAIAQHVGELGTGSWIYDTPTQYQQGALESTGNALDLAISGPGFFSVQTPQGVRYTRDGQFIRNAQGLLSTQDGNLVLGQNGPVVIADGKLDIARSGAVSVNGVVQNQLQVTEFANSTALRKQGDNLFVDTGSARPVPATASVVQQGFLEKSNANVVRSMVDLIVAERWFDANQKSMQTEDDATGLAINTVGNTKQ